MDTDRNLLLGMLALQADLIDATRFAEASSAWAAHLRGRPATQRSALLHHALRQGAGPHFVP